jgi:hypothetical protein
MIEKNIFNNNSEYSSIKLIQHTLPCHKFHIQIGLTAKGMKMKNMSLNSIDVRLFVQI